MIFTAGFLSFIFGWVVMNAYGDKFFFRMNRADYVGATFVLIGAAGMIYSLCVIFLRYMP